MILQLSVFYRNDLPNGFGFTFNLNPNELARVWTEITSAYDRMWEDEPEPRLGLISLLTSQLEAIVRKPQADRTMQDALLALGNLYLLERLGVMTSNDFNGVLKIESV